MGLPPRLRRKAFNLGLIIEVTGAKRNVLKFLPPLMIEEETLKGGLDIFDEAIQATIHEN